ncbi:NUDIX hydrolase [Beduini massiliensis]|uniref:NUDIX hydrolase n=1 Tax=Beduini massiliensis TaxID=1585974 RepID=UPI00059A7A22|nr:NUDIX hydrolase [Beduini massiliensis]
MNYMDLISNFKPSNEQEETDYRIIQNYIETYRDNVLLRDNEIAHITSSGFIMNPTLDKVLLIHHNIRNAWAWTGGHADGDADLLGVAIKEAREETGVQHITPLTDKIASVDILPVFSHTRRGQYVNAHLHLSVAYILICDEGEPLSICPGENTGVEWLSIDKFTNEYFDNHDVYLYNKLIQFAKNINNNQ